MSDYSIQIQELANVEDFLENIVPELRRVALKRGVAGACKVVRDAAKRRVPVDTGTLKKSISYVVREYDEAIVGVVGIRRGSTAEVNGRVRDANRYGRLVEYGTTLRVGKHTRRVGARPFLRSAADETKYEQEAAISTALGEAVRASLAGG